jgi:ketosteroid isomerase-like protein
MYKAAARALIRRNIRLLNEGRYDPALAMFASDAELTFPGQNSWSRQYRVPGGSRTQAVTHRGRDEIQSFLQRYVEFGIQMEVEDILVNGPPWRTRVAVRAQTFVPSTAGPDRYNNRAVAFIELRWGRIVRWEDYEDCERVAEWDRSKGSVGAMP